MLLYIIITRDLEEIFIRLIANIYYYKFKKYYLTK